MFFKSKLFNKLFDAKNRWRSKATNRRKELKALLKRMDEVKKSRDFWKEKATYYKNLYDEAKKKVYRKENGSPKINPKNIGIGPKS